MRLLCTLDNEQETKLLSQYLNEHKIENNYEFETNRDWGSENYGNVNAKVWVIEEDQFEIAEKLYETFKANPNVVTPVIPSVIEPISEFIIKEEEEVKRYLDAKRSLVTAYLLIFCCLLFFISELSAPKVPSFLPPLPLTPVLSSPIKTFFLYDFPKTYELVTQFINLYGIDSLAKVQNLPSDAQRLLHEIDTTPYWQGIYGKIVGYFQNPELTQLFDAPLFEKIRQGQIWRLFTPILLHGDLLHLLFNMLWLFVLGKQMEQRLGHWRFILFILIAAAVSNTAQYLMTGPNFLGFSGVLCAMLTFIWMRQKKTPWEGYQLQHSTFLFILIFVFGMLALQLLVFSLEIYTKHALAISIANTAHIAGLLIGLLLGNMNAFARKT